MSLRKHAVSVSQKHLGAKGTRALKALLTGDKGPTSRPKSPPKPTPDYDNNKIINHPRLNNADIVFKGKNNIFYCESSDAILHDCKIIFEGDNSVVYWSEYRDKKRKHHINIYAKSDTAIYIGKNVNFHLNARFQPYLMASEGKNIVIGDDCLFSLGLWFRTSDGHAAYDSVTKKRLNVAKSIFIGDHVWLGQDVTILKGSRIGSGSIIGAGSIVTGRSLSSNTSCAGVPARELKQGVFFNKPNVNGYSSTQLDKIETCDTSEWIYSHDKKTTLSFDDIDKGLSAAKTSDKKLAYIKKHLANAHHKNRFYIGE